MKPKISMVFAFFICFSPSIFACESDADCANNQVCNDAGKCVPDDTPNIQEFLKENKSLESKVVLTEEFKSAEAADSELCGLQWVRDENAISVWRAQRRTSVWVNELASYGGITRILVTLNTGETLRLKIGRQGLTCA